MHASAIICLSQNFENSHCCRVQAEITPVSFTLLWTVFQTPDDIFSIRTLASYRIFQLGVSWTTGLKFYPCTYFSNFGWQKGLSYLLSSKRHSSSRKRLSFHNSHKLASISLTLTLIHQPHPQDKRKPYKKPNLGTETEPFTRVLVERL
jgi:hypothetical protein